MELTYKCVYCLYETTNKTNFNRHNESTKHEKCVEIFNKKEEKMQKKEEKKEKDLEKMQKKEEKTQKDLEKKEKEELKKQKELEEKEEKKQKDLEKKEKEEEKKQKELEDKEEKKQKDLEKKQKELEEKEEKKQKDLEKKQKEAIKEQRYLEDKEEKKQKELEKKQKETAKNADVLEKKLIKQQKEAELLIEKEKRALKTEKRESKQVKQEEKQELKEIAKIEKEKALIEESIAIDWRDFYYHNIKDILKFNWIKEINGNHFFSNLLLAIVSNEKLNCCRIKDKKYEMWERHEDGDKWTNMFMEDEYDFNDIAYRLLDIMYDCPLLSSHKNRKEFIAYDLDKEKGNPLLKGVLRKILGGNGADVLEQREQEYNNYNEKVLDEREEIENVVLSNIEIREKRIAEMDTEEYRIKMNKNLADDNPFSIQNIKNWNYDVSYNKVDIDSDDDDVLNTDGIEYS